jgi:hypothetical protein
MEEKNVSPRNKLDKWRPAGDSPAPDNMSTMSSGELKEPEKTVEKLQDLLRLAEKGQEDAVPEIRQILNEHPDLAWRFVDVAQIAEDALIEKMTREEDLATKEILRCQLEAMREEIAGENPSPLERLLAERIVATWLQIQLFEGLYTSGMSKKSSMTIAQGSFHQKRLDQTYRRHLSAIRALAQMRKLLKGASITQINIAEKQINTTG